MVQFRLIWLMLALGMTVTRNAAAEQECIPLDGSGAQRCIVGLPSFAATIFAKRQEFSQWCWAASISMVFGHYGLDVNQSQIVAEGWGEVVNMPGSPAQIVTALNRQWADTKGRIWAVRGTTHDANPFTAADDLANNRPLIIGTMGHAMVLTAITYDTFPDGSAVVQSATVRDPWPGKGKRDLNAEEWFSTTFLARISVQPAGDLSDSIDQLARRDLGPDAPTWDVSTGVGMGGGAAQGSSSAYSGGVTYVAGITTRRFVWFDRQDEKAQFGFDIGIGLDSTVISPAAADVGWIVRGQVCITAWLSRLGLRTCADESALVDADVTSLAWRQTAGIGATLSSSPASKRFLAQLSLLWKPLLDGDRQSSSMNATITQNAFGGFLLLEHASALKPLGEGFWLGSIGLQFRSPL
jgi:hypothetical protein